ncbi:MAG: sugar phosphate isomerase/epimerase [Planctomycetes bacterium]|nr:sugar phosphate isomerase/epimerase [Planctomycetota bacterium]
MRQALAVARKLDVSGVELASTGEFTPRNLSQTARRELRHLFRSHSLEPCALVCPLRHGLDVAENQEPRIELIREVMSLSFDLGPRLVVVDPGKIPVKDDDPRAPLMKDALLALGRHGDRVGVTLALVTGADSGEVLAGYLDRFDTGSLGACFSPGLFLVGGHDPYAAARALGKKVAYAHATDARHTSSRGAALVPLGHGDIDWLQMLGTLEEIGYHGWLTVPAEAGPDAAAAVQFLGRLRGF